jgi:hypothetical protein
MATKPVKMTPKQAYKHEMAEGKALRAKKMSVDKYMQKERSEGEKPSKKTAQALKKGQMKPSTYAKKHAKEHVK